MHWSEFEYKRNIKKGKLYSFSTELTQVNCCAGNYYVLYGKNNGLPYHERTCTLCKYHDVQDEYHVTLICEYMMEFIKLMNTYNSIERFNIFVIFKNCL